MSGAPDAVANSEIRVGQLTGVSVFDFSFKGQSSDLNRTLVELDIENRKTDLWYRYDNSFEWIFYRRAKASTDQLAESLPGTFRYVFPPAVRADAAEGNDDEAEQSAASPDPEVASRWDIQRLGWTLLISPEHDAGVASFWTELRPLDGSRSLDDALQAKKSVLLGSDQLDELLESDLELDEIERHYPLVAVRLADQLTAGEALSRPVEQTSRLGRLFTGGDEHEDASFLSGYVAEQENVSRRSYERLFVRWTDALAIYDADYRGTNNYETEYREVTARAAQILETCVLVRRVLRNLGSDIERSSALVGVLRPWLVWRTRTRLVRRFTDVERAYSIAPPFQSSEGERLVSSMYERFGIDALFDSTRRSYDLLERRLAIVESQYLLAAAVVAFIVNAIIQLLD